MDRDRLRQIEQSDLTEGRLNEDFVDWLKTKGPTWLLVILVAIAAYIFVINWKRGRVNDEVDAWQSYTKAKLPAELEEIADGEQGEYGAIAPLARLNAADAYLTAVQRNRTLNSLFTPAPAPTEDGEMPTPAPEVEDEPLTDELRAQYLDRAERLYNSLFEGDIEIPRTLLFEITALNGKAAVAEARGNAERAAELYRQAAEKASPSYPHLAEQAENRAANVTEYAAAIHLPTMEDIEAVAASAEEGDPETPVAAELHPQLRSIIFPGESAPTAPNRPFNALPTTPGR